MEFSKFKLSIAVPPGVYPLMLESERTRVLSDAVVPANNIACPVALPITLIGVTFWNNSPAANPYPVLTHPVAVNT